MVTILVLILLFFTISCEDQNNFTEKDFIERIGDLYEKYSLPSTIGNETRTLDISILIKSIYDISEMESSMTVQYTLILKWWDKRLMFQPFLKNDQMIYEITLNGYVLKDEGKVACPYGEIPLAIVYT